VQSDRGSWKAMRRRALYLEVVRPQEFLPVLGLLSAKRDKGEHNQRRLVRLDDAAQRKNFGDK
jgi:hypothetical protein